MVTAAREYRDRLFVFIFGSEAHKDWTLSLYNAVNGTDYSDPDEVTINTVGDVLYLGMHNDVSFLIAESVNLYEQQSTLNPNMPLRMLQYSGQLYEKYVAQKRLDKYGPRQLRLPAPRLVLFYNGGREIPDESWLRLSDSFPAGAKSDIEVSVRVLNINGGRNAGLMEACRALREYAWIVDTIRGNRKAMGPAEAVGRAVESMPAGFVLRAYLLAHKAEVVDMLLTEYNEAEVLEIARENAAAEGRAEGRAEGIVSMCRKFGAPMTAAVVEVCRALEVSQKDAEDIVALYWE